MLNEIVIAPHPAKRRRDLHYNVEEEKRRGRGMLQIFFDTHRDDDDTRDTSCDLDDDTSANDWTLGELQCVLTQ